MNQLLNDLWNNIQGYYADFIALLPKLVLALLVFSILLFIANRTRNTVNHRLSSRMDDPLLARFLSRMAKTAIVILALLAVLQIIGLGTVAGGLLASAGLGAFIIGFAFKDLGENFLAGIMLAFNRPFRVGDIVELDGKKGKVITLNLRNAQIKSFDGKDIYIPNANVIKNPVVNYTIDGFLRHEFVIGLDYGDDINAAIRVILDNLNQVEGILQDDKAPSVLVTDLGVSTLNLTAFYWIDTFDSTISAGTVKTEAVRRVMSALNQAGFYLPNDILEIKNYRTSSLKAS